MAKKKRTSTVKKIAIAAGVLILAEAVFLVFFQSEEPLDIRKAIEEQVKKQPSLNIERRELLRIQLALQDYVVKNSGKPPTSLNELVPTYFDSLPKNPRTNTTFKYTVSGNKYTIGEDVALSLAASTGKSEDGGTKGEQDLLIASLTDKSETEPFVYDPTGKRDPFLPFNFAPPKIEGQGSTPLEQYDIGQLKLTAVLKGFDEPTAIVENAVGKGFPVKIGTKIGLHGGEIVDIQPDRLLILETQVDFTGESKTRTIEMKLRTKDQQPAN